MNDNNDIKVTIIGLIIKSIDEDSKLTSGEIRKLLHEAIDSLED